MHVFVSDEPLTSVGDTSVIPTIFTLYQCYPNPFNPMTTIRYELWVPAVTTIEIFDISGRLVRVLKEPSLETEGIHLINWNGKDRNGRNVASGTYFYRLEAGDFAKTKRMVLIR